MPENVPYVFEVVLGCYNPRLAIITTPNKDFNVNFNTLKYKSPSGESVRHPGHFFEWTHTEFKTWCGKYALKYGYSVSFCGVGFRPRAAIETMTSENSCTQICIFTRETQHNIAPGCNQVAYEIVYSTDFPYKDAMSFSYDEIVDEVINHSEYLIIQSYIDAHGAIDDIQTADPYSETISANDIISADENCLEIKYSSCMLLPSIRVKVINIETLKNAIQSECGKNYFSHSENNESFLIKKIVFTMFTTDGVDYE